MRVVVIVGAVLLALGSTVAGALLPLHPVSWIALVAAGCSGAFLVVVRTYHPMTTHRACWPLTTTGLLTSSTLLVAAGGVARSSPAAALALLVTVGAVVTVLVSAADAVTVARPPHAARPDDVALLARFDPRVEAGQAREAGLVAGMTVATAAWVSGVVEAGLHLVPPVPALVLGVGFGAVVAAVVGLRCLPAALRLQRAVTSGDGVSDVRLARSARRGLENRPLPPDMLVLVPLWASRALVVSTILRLAGPAVLVALVSLGGAAALTIWPTLLTLTLLVLVLMVGLAWGPVGRLRWERRLVELLAPPRPPTTSDQRLGSTP